LADSSRVKHKALSVDHLEMTPEDIQKNMETMPVALPSALISSIPYTPAQMIAAGLPLLSY
jgi:hypothetical protein